MDITGTYTFNAPRDRVWALLMDVDAIAGCMPGCKGFRALGDDRYEAELSAGVAAVSGDFKATIALVDQQPPQAYTLRVDANGRPGFVKGEALVTLSGEGERRLAEVRSHRTALVARRLGRLDAVQRATLAAALPALEALLEDE